MNHEFIPTSIENCQVLLLSFDFFPEKTRVKDFEYYEQKVKRNLRVKILNLDRLEINGFIRFDSPDLAIERLKGKEIDLLIVEDDFDTIGQILRKCDHAEIIKQVVVCDHHSTVLSLIESPKIRTPKIITLDFQLTRGDTNFELTEALYEKIKTDWSDSYVFGLTNNENQPPARHLEGVIRAKGEFVFDKEKFIGLLDYILRNIIQIRGLQIENQRLTSKVERQKKEITQSFPLSSNKDYLIGKALSIRKVWYDLQVIKASRISPILILGETGTGKELIARAIYEDHPIGEFSNQNCSEFVGADPNVALSELFGHKKGTFTGAERDKKGIFETYQHGTIFLDEIANLPLVVQNVLLKVVGQKEFFKIGDKTNPIKTQARLIFATNVDLDKAIEDKTFKGDFFYRISTKVINLPPLRERLEDIPELVQFFLSNKKSINEIFGNSNIHFSINPRAMAKLKNCSYPGNIRQLKKIIENGMLNARYQNREDKSNVRLDVHHLQLPDGETFYSEKEIRTVKTFLDMVQEDAAKVINDLEISPAKFKQKDLTDSVEITGKNNYRQRLNNFLNIKRHGNQRVEIIRLLFIEDINRWEYVRIISPFNKFIER